MAASKENLYYDARAYISDNTHEFRRGTWIKEDQTVQK